VKTSSVQVTIVLPYRGTSLIRPPPPQDPTVAFLCLGPYGVPMGGGGFLSARYPSTPPPAVVTCAPAATPWESWTHNPLMLSLPLSLTHTHKHTLMRGGCVCGGCVSGLRERGLRVERERELRERERGSGLLIDFISKAVHLNDFWSKSKSFKSLNLQNGSKPSEF
jgi:hypothetical protein